MAVKETRKVRVIMIGVGGSSCSGKTTLAKHLQTCLPNSFVIHQDDFAPPMEEVPIHPTLGIQDWDDAPGAIVWPKLAKELEYVKTFGTTSDSHYSHDHLNAQKPVAVAAETVQKWKKWFSEIQATFAKKGETVVFAIADGFLLYWYPDVYNALDVRIFLRVPEPTLKARRVARGSYITAEGVPWLDPPGYWEDIVYPAYVRAHQDLFVGGDMASNALTGKVPNLVVFDGEEMNLTELLDRTCQKVANAVEGCKL